MLIRIFSKFSKVIFSAAILLSAQFAAADVAGKWSFAVDVMGQTGNATVTIEQESDTAIRGVYSGQLGNTDFTGTQEGEEISFALVSDLGSVTYTGTMQDNGTISGKVDFAGMAEGTFVATKAN
ncbi:MAG: hypothetical protein R3332_03230 [Pseudohongiellaceae bacterium]|nr:hypothetical protein [Pseudohongiellaceae bacterium]